MSKLLVVFGATGNQGKSVIDQVLQDPELAGKYKIRGLTRDPSSSSSQALAKKGVEVVKCDTSKDADVKAALKGANEVFLMTWSIHTPNGGKEEEALGNHLADLVVESGANYLIWSSMISPAKLSGGKYKNVTIFESKYNTEHYIRTLPIKASFFVPASFYQNWHRPGNFRKMEDGSFGLISIWKPDTRVPFIDVSEDTGKWIVSMLADPDKYAGKAVAAASHLYTQSEVVEIMSKVYGKQVKNATMPVKQWEKFLPEGIRQTISEMNQYVGDTGYYGSNMEEEIRWGQAQAKGKLTTLEEYLKREPLKLE